MSPACAVAVIAALILFAALVIEGWAARQATRQVERLTEQNRVLSEQARNYQAETARLAARNSELRDQVDAANGTAGEPTLTEAVYADLALLPITHPGDPR